MKRIANRDARGYVSRLKEFTGSNLSGHDSETLYKVVSYGWYPVLIYDKSHGLWFVVDNNYSRSTGRHISQCRPVGVECHSLSEDGMKVVAEGGYNELVARRLRGEAL